MPAPCGDLPGSCAAAKDKSMIDPVPSNLQDDVGQQRDEELSAPGPTKLAAVVVNPTKVADSERFRDTVRQSMREHGWGEPLWIETTAADPGRGPAHTAVAAGAGLVLACGGDGTVTACAESL